MPDKPPKRWEDRVRLFLKAEIKRADITYDQLAERLRAHGFKESGASIANKLARATFAATFFLAALTALEIDGLRLEDF